MLMAGTRPTSPHFSSSAVCHVIIGEIFRELVRLQLDDRTLVIYLSDNGPEVGNSEEYTGSAAPLRGRKYSNWEGGARVPAIMRWPALF